MSPEERAIEEVCRYYTSRIEQHGASASGVDWRDEVSQETRFEQLALVLKGDTTSSLADIGCGYGALARFLRGEGWHGLYEGVDISSGMIEAAGRFLTAEKDVHLTVGRMPAQPADYVVASGVFNVKITAEICAWERHVFRTIDEMVSLARKGVACNFLTSWSDAPLMRDDLYYAAPERIFEYCAARHSRWIELSQDYGLFEFTVRMRLDRPASRLRVGS